MNSPASYSFSFEPVFLVLSAAAVYGYVRLARTVERPSRTHVNVAPSSGWVRAKVKWFNRARGFGFVSEGEGKPGTQGTL